MPPVDRWDRDLAQDGHARITAPRRWLFLALAASVVLFPLGLDLWFGVEANRVVAGFLLGASVFGAVVSGWRFARPPRLDVTPVGVRYRRLEVPWSDIVGVHERTTGAQRYVLLHLTDEAAARIGSRAGVQRRLLRGDDDTRGRPCVEIPGPFDHHDELVAWLEEVRLRQPDGGARPD